MGGADLEPGEVQLDHDEEHRRDNRDRDSRKRDKDRHEDSSKDHRKNRDRDKERDSKEKDRENRDKERNRDREKDREHRDNKDKDREDRDKERNRDKEKDREHRDNKDKDREDRDKERNRDNKEKERNRDKEKDRENKGRDIDKENDRDKDRNRDKEKDRENRDKERNRDKHGDKEKDKDKVREKDKEREKTREREKDRDKSKDKERNKNRDKDKDKPRERERSTEREKEKEKEASRKTDKKDDEKAAQLREKITKMKEERLKEREKEEEKDSEILSWVSKSRKIEDKRREEREKARKLSQALEEQDKLFAGSDDDDDYGSAGPAKDHLAGMKILHGLDKVIEGGAVVLTLKDQDILADGDLNTEVDMLENVEIGEQKNRDDLYQASKKKTGIYTDKFSDDPGYKKPMLSQYDDPVEDEGVTLDEGGRFTAEAEKKLEELRKRIAGVSTQKAALDLTSTTKISSEYYTQEEMLQFKKPKKKKSLRKKEKLDLDALEAEARASGLGSEDLGSRNDPTRLGKIEDKEKMELESRKSVYKAAIEKAEVETRISRQAQITGNWNDGNESLVFGDDYEDLQKSVEQARKLAMMRNKEENNLDLKKIVNLATEKKVNNNNEMEIDDNKNINNDNGNDNNDNGDNNKVVITEMEEFVWGLQLKQETRKPETEDVFMEEADSPVPQPPQQDEKTDISGWSEVTDSSPPTESQQLPLNSKTAKEEDEEQKDEVAPDEMIHEAAVGKGLSGALRLLKDRGTLNEGIDWGGRTMDKKKSKLVDLIEEPGPKDKEIRIERTDEFGRIMTPKEAFRALSHKFHGKGPGKMKQEKRLKKYQDDLKAKQMRDSDTPLQSMEKMREAQARMKTPYLVLSGHVKPGQTSDPRSGFATVEKDVGSLTPMLGDRKVEHFLGIKRNSEAGSMPPPPPKKPKK